MHLRKRRDERGFTLIEVMSAVGIALSLAGLAIPSYLNAQLKSKRTEVVTNVRGILDATRIYWGQNSALLTVPQTPSSAPTNTQVPWNDHTGQFANLGFEADGSVYCRYQVGNVAAISGGGAAAAATGLQSQIDGLTAAANALRSITPVDLGAFGYFVSVPVNLWNMAQSAMGGSPWPFPGLNPSLNGPEASVTASLGAMASALDSEASALQSDLDALNAAGSAGGSVLAQITGICDLDGDGVQIEHTIFWNPDLAADFDEFQSWAQTGNGNTW